MRQEKVLFIEQSALFAKSKKRPSLSLEELDFMPGIFSALFKLKQAGFSMVLLCERDANTIELFEKKGHGSREDLYIKVFKTQNIVFDEIVYYPSLSDRIRVQKDKVYLLLKYLRSQTQLKQCSYVISDTKSDKSLAENLGVNWIEIDTSRASTWDDVEDAILMAPRCATITRETKETVIRIDVNLDSSKTCQIATGIRFYDHMLEQVIKHAGISSIITVSGDLDVDDHHTVEDTAIALGTAIKDALGDKYGIGRFGFTVPMDEALASVSLDLSGRAFCKIKYTVTREKVGDMATEMVEHFFKSFADGLQGCLHVEAKGENTHHCIESMFKALGRTLRQALKRDSESIPSSKGVL